MVTKIQRLPSVLEDRGRSRSAHYNDIKEGLFTSPVLVGLRAVGWPDYEVNAVNAARIAGATDSEIRKLVSELMEKRKTLKWDGGQQ